MNPEAPSSEEILKLARRHFQHGHRPIPVYWRLDGSMQPMVPSYAHFFDDIMTEREFNELFLDKDRKLQRRIQGFGILTCPSTGVLGWDIDVKGDGKPDGD